MTRLSSNGVNNSNLGGLQSAAQTFVVAAN